MTSQTAAWTAALVLLLAVAGCGQPHQAEVLTAAEQFYSAQHAGDGAKACDRLAPKTKSDLEKSAGKPCARAVLEEDVPAIRDPRRVEVFGTMAQVRYGADTAFLARFQGGWKVMAVGCRPQHDKPYDCLIGG
jgi:hypothetical protein